MATNNTYVNRSQLVNMATRAKLIERIKKKWPPEVLAERYLDRINMAELRELVFSPDEEGSK